MYSREDAKQAWARRRADLEDIARIEDVLAEIDAWAKELERRTAAVLHRATCTRTREPLKLLFSHGRGKPVPSSMPPRRKRVEQVVATRCQLGHHSRVMWTWSEGIGMPDDNSTTCSTLPPTGGVRCRDVGCVLWRRSA